MSVFDDFYLANKLEQIMTKAKTLSKKECEAIYFYLQKKKPLVLMEFGVQHGCSTRFFIDAITSLNLATKIHSWDIVDQIRYADRSKFTFHRENITGHELDVVEKYNPDLIFLDAHAYHMTKSLMEICMDRKIDFICHDVGIEFKDLVYRQSNAYKNKNVYIQWESYLLSELISPTIWETNSYEDDKVQLTFIRDRYGICIAEMK